MGGCYNYILCNQLNDHCKNHRAKEAETSKTWAYMLNSAEESQHRTTL